MSKELLLVVDAVAAEKGNTHAASDAGVAALMSEAACRGAVYNVRIHVGSITDKSAANPLAEKAAVALQRARAAVERATAAVERNIGG